MSAKMEYNIDKYIKQSTLPTYWCPGCGMGVALNAMLHGIDSMNWKQNEVVFVSGIGCSSRAPQYTDLHGVQTTHGRALSYATGIKMANPNLKVVVLIGDGDAAAIGGNHLIHAARRNIDLTVIVVNNMIYGMTGGQISPTSPLDTISTTSGDGNLERPLDICGVAKTAGASYVARITVEHVFQMHDYVKRGMENEGFSLIEVLTPCQTNYGRRNGFKSQIEIMKSFKENCVFINKEKPMKLEPNKTLIGELYYEPTDEYSKKYWEYVKIANSKQNDRTIDSDEKNIIGKIKKRTDIRFSGLGGYGLVLSGVLYANASLQSKINATHVTSYGPEARGGASRSDLVLAPWEEDIYYPEIINTHILFALTQESLDKYGPQAEELIVVDESLKLNDLKLREGVRVISLPILKTALEKSNNLLSVGTICMGVLTKYLKAFPLESIKDLLNKQFSGVVLEKNIETLEAGYNIMNLNRE